MKKDKRILIPRDEFEEEAGEGLGRLSREEAEADLRELKARMDSRVARPRTIWLPAAAAVLILLVASAVVVSLLRERPAGGPDLAQAEESLKDTAYIAMAQPIDREEKALPPRDQSGSMETEIMDEVTEDLFMVVEEDAGDQVVIDEPVVIAQVAEEEVEVPEEVVVQVVPQAGMSTMKARAPGSDKKAAEGARRSDEAAAEPIAAAAAAPTVPEGASPLGGWDEFIKWMARNIRYPEGIEPVVRQVVTVSFMVQPDSTLSGLRAVSSPGEPFTREAFRLLREGPKWVPADSKTQASAKEITVTFVFR
ncbi:MAG: energy transducer TonB [Bacteroidales bacterium]|nr:energy transducer TonB [Bacteroidales bacterium]